MSLLGIDIGTTNLKAGLFDRSGKLMDMQTTPNTVYQDQDSFSYYDPAVLVKSVMTLINTLQAQNKQNIEAIGITSMAESGLLVEETTGRYISPIIPWFDRRTDKIADRLKEEMDELDRFKKTGIKHSYKHGIAKILWLKEAGYDLGEGVKWLSAADFIAFHLTGVPATDYTLAARTYAFRIDTKEWDTAFIQACGLKEDIFPEVKPSYEPVGEVSDRFQDIGIQQGTPVVIGGHDHVCAALAVRAVTPEVVLDSIGTAETLVGAVPERPINEEDYHSGLNFGIHVLPDRLFWMGAIQSAGGSIEWLRQLLADETLAYDRMLALLEQTDKQPTGILYFPYIAGSGAPLPDPKVNGAFIGLKSSHGKADVIKAVLEGLTYEFEWIKDTIEKTLRVKIDSITAVGGGTKNNYWMQLKSDVSKSPVTLPHIKEATLMGAAMLAGLAKGIYQDETEMLKVLASMKKETIQPDSTNYKKYRDIYQNGYLRLQDPIRQLYANTE